MGTTALFDVLRSALLDEAKDAVDDDGYAELWHPDDERKCSGQPQELAKKWFICVVG